MMNKNKNKIMMMIMMMMMMKIYDATKKRNEKVENAGGQHRLATSGCRRGEGPDEHRMGTAAWPWPPCPAYLPGGL